MNEDFPDARAALHGLIPADVIDLFADSAKSPQKLRVALVGTYAPRRCGIATFTTDVRQKLGAFSPASMSMSMRWTNQARA
jgi:hypothetical protein